MLRFGDFFVDPLIRRRLLLLQSILPHVGGNLRDFKRFLVSRVTLHLGLPLVLKILLMLGLLLFELLFKIRDLLLVLLL